MTLTLEKTPSNSIFEEYPTDAPLKIASYQGPKRRHPVYCYSLGDFNYQLDDVLSKDEGVIDDAKLEGLLGVKSPNPKARNRKACTGYTAITNKGDYVLGHNEDGEGSALLILNTKPRKSADSKEKRYNSTAIIEVERLMKNKNLEGGDVKKLYPYIYLMSGMNEMGLAIANYTVVEGFIPANDTEPPQLPNGGETDITTEPPFDKSRKSYWHYIFSRIILDRAATVKDAVALIEKEYNYNLPEQKDPGPSEKTKNGKFSLQLHISDATGQAVVVNFINGKVQLTYKKNQGIGNHWDVIANNLIYNKSLEELSKDIPDMSHSRKRFRAVYYALRDTAWVKDDREKAEDLLEILKKPSVEKVTEFSVIYNQTKKEIYVRFNPKAKNSKTFSYKVS